MIMHKTGDVHITTKMVFYPFDSLLPGCRVIARSTGVTHLAFYGMRQALSWQVLLSATWSSVTLCIALCTGTHSLCQVTNRRTARVD